ncbi:hypothetical protein LLEC1_04479 [Akanthomyces lecanii]|uniref:Uncharacterized protein n=1 Tax=Cordyceps confragosa TaxID=2714763 RepID=A0A179I6E1_CORDF|nr:hypothetical protein LLEC1_04479 [Akanthomyces lecanii]
MSSGNENPPPSYREATAQATSGSLRDELRPEGWVEGYVEAPPATHQTSEYSPPAPTTEKPAHAMGTPVLDGDGSPAEEHRTQDTADDQTRGNDVGGWGVKIGPVLLGLVDVEEEKQLREGEEGGRS